MNADNKIIKYTIDNRYLVLLKDQETKDFDYLIIDYLEGKILDDVLDKEKIGVLVRQIKI